MASKMVLQAPDDNTASCASHYIHLNPSAIVVESQERFPLSGVDPSDLLQGPSMALLAWSLSSQEVWWQLESQLDIQGISCSGFLPCR